MKRRTGALLLAVLGSGGLPGGSAPAQSPAVPANASKAAPSYRGVARAIEEVTKPWDQPGATAPEAAPGWRAFFGALDQELEAYAVAPDEKARLAALGRIHAMNSALAGVSWSGANKVYFALNEWLYPRVRIAWAERHLVDFVRGQAAADPATSANHENWVRFVGGDLAGSLATYEGAKTVQARQEALKGLTGALAALRARNRAYAWAYSTELQSAIDALYDQPNLDVSIDAGTIAPFLSNDIVQTGPIARNGYVSQVTAGPRTGFGLMSSDEGIAFFNSQLASTVTPITDFQQQLQQDRKGRKVSKLYGFGATSFDTPELTVTAILRPNSGVTLSPTSTHSITAAFSATPQPGKGLARGVLNVLGLNQQKITDKVGQQAYPRIAQGVVQGANEEAAERIPGVESQLNGQLGRVLVGNNTLAVRDFRVTDLLLRSRPTNALVSGKVGHAAVPDALGASQPQPPELTVPASGVSIDLNLTSTLTNAIAGLMESGQVKGVENFVIATKAVEPNAPPRDGVTIGKNVDFPTFLRTVDEVRAANDPKVTALRIKRPATAPEVAADERGYLVILVRDFQLDVPSPPGGLLGGNTKVLRFVVPTAEFVLSFRVPPRETDRPLEFDAKVEDFVHGPGSRVQTLSNDEDKPTTLGPLQANLALAGFRNKLAQTPIKVPLANLNLQGFDLQQVSPLDPTGWMRVVLVPNGQPVNVPRQSVATGESVAVPPARAEARGDTSPATTPPTPLPAPNPGS